MDNATALTTGLGKPFGFPTLPTSLYYKDFLYLKWGKEAGSPRHIWEG
jgi:hypothetical protein